MTAMRVPKQDWRAILDWVSRILEGRRAEIEVDALAIGAQLQGKNLVMFGLVYDDKDDLIEIALEGLDHLIHKPRELTIEDSVRGLMAIEIIDADDARHIVKLTEPLSLPPAAPE
jgi:hypothetical protein